MSPYPCSNAPFALLLLVLFADLPPFSCVSFLSQILFPVGEHIGTTKDEETKEQWKERNKERCINCNSESRSPLA